MDYFAVIEGENKGAPSPNLFLWVCHVYVAKEKELLVTRDNY